MPDATKRQMFGYPSCVLGGNMFIALHDNYVILGLSEADRARLLTQPEERTFEPMAGRPMREYVVVPDRITRFSEAEAWVASSHAYAAATLAP